MKGKIVRGSGFRGVLNYVLDEDKSARIIGGNLLGRDAEALAAEFAPVRRIRKDCQRPVLHVALRMPEGEDVSDERWLQIVVIFMRMMKLSHARPWTVIKHLNNHIHIITSRVDNHGNIWTGQWEALRCIQATQDIEKLLGLTITPGLKGGDRRQTRLTSGQLRKYQREVERGETAVIPVKVAITERIKQAIEASDGTFPDFQSKVESLGVKVSFNTAKTTNHVSGIIFQFEGFAIKGSKVARAYSWQGLNQLLTERKRQYEHSRNSQPTPPALPQSNERRATQPIPAGVGEQPDEPGIELVIAGKVAPPSLDQSANADDDALADLCLSGPAGMAIEAGTAAVITVARKTKRSRRQYPQNCEIAGGDGKEMTMN